MGKLTGRYIITGSRESKRKRGRRKRKKERIRPTSLADCLMLPSPFATQPSGFFVDMKAFKTLRKNFLSNIRKL